jgi:hypothetical protein
VHYNILTTSQNSKRTAGETTMNSNNQFDLDLIQDVSADEAENVTGGWRWGDIGEEPPPPPPPPDGQMVNI